MTPSAPTAPAGLSVLLRLAWPVVVARATQSVIGFCDVLMVAPLGDAPLAAAATGSLNAFAVGILPIGMAFIVQSFSAQLTGAGDHAGARRYAFYGLLLALLTGALSLAALPFLPGAVRRFGFAADVEAAMTGYLGIRLLAMAPMVGMEVLGAWYAGRGLTRPHMLAGAVAMVANVLLNWMFIQGHWGAPALGVNGAALASVLATWAGFAYLVVGYLRTPVPWSAPRWSELVRMVRFGLPNGCSWFLEFGAFLIFINVAIAHLGTVPLAAVNVVIQINSVAFMPAFGLASAGAVLVGQARGRGDFIAIGTVVRTTLFAACAWECGVGLAYLLIPGAFLVWFQQPGESLAMVAMATLMLRVSAAWQLFDGVAMVLAETLRAVGDTAWSLWARLALAWAAFVPGALLAVFYWESGAVGALLAMIGYLALLSGVYLWRYRGGAWRRIDLTGLGALTP